MQKPLPPAAGFVQAVPDAEPYPPFPRDTLGRLRWAEDATIGNLAAKATLIVLAHHADKADGKAWPATVTLAGWLDMTPRGVRKALRFLARGGWLVSDPREGKSTFRWPKSPAEHLCPECFARFEREAIPCPSCGYTGDLLQPLGAERGSGEAERGSGEAERGSPRRSREELKKTQLP